MTLSPKASDLPVDILILTAADGEDDAVRAVDDGAVDDWTDKPAIDHAFPVWRRTYRADNGRLLHVALSRAGQMGGDAAAAAASGLVKLLKPRCLAMCGVCAGRPQWTNLGDVIIADQVYRYDAGEVIAQSGVSQFKPDITTYQLHPTWKQPAQNYDVSRHRQVLDNRPRLRDDQQLWILNELLEKRDPRQSSVRSQLCPDWSAVLKELWDLGDVVRDDLQLTEQGRQRILVWRLQHPDGPPPSDLPKVHVFPLGTGNHLQRDDGIFDRLGSSGKRLIHGLDMEASAVGLVGFEEQVPYTIIAKGVMDFAEPGRSYQYRGYAARAAAEILLGFLRQQLDGDRKTAADILETGLQRLPQDFNQYGPARLLLARHEVVEWDDELRRHELEILHQWTHESRGLSVRLFTGPGGSGKTRLFVEWTKRLRGMNWDAGWLPHELIDHDCTGVADVATLVTNSRPTFIAIDYAESRGYLEQFLTQACRLRAGRADLPPLRIALLARSEADWYLSLRESSLDLQDLLDRNSPLELREVPLEGAQRARTLQRAIAAFAKNRLVNPPAIDHFSLDDDRFQRVLYIHMAALALVDRLVITADTLLSQILQHETDFWTRPFASANWNSHRKGTFLRGARRWVAALTLLGGAPDKATAERLRVAADGPEVQEFLDQLGRLYPGSGRPQTQDRYLAKLEPDLLGEELVSSVLEHAETASNFLSTISVGASPAAIENAFTVLGHLAWHFGKDSGHWIKDLLETDLDQRAEPALRAARALGEKTTSAPIGKSLAELVHDKGSVALAKRLEEKLAEMKLPERSVSLRELAVCVWRKQLDGLPTDTIEAVQVERARLCNNLGGGLSKLGWREAALDAANESVQTFRTLATQRSELFLPNLAKSLNNLGIRLSELGRREAALAATEEAVDIYRRLDTQRPDAFLPDLAMSLNNLGNMLSELGLREAALAATEEAVAIRRRLATQRPDAFLPDLAMSLNNLGHMLSQFGRHEAALVPLRESVKHHITLTKQHRQVFLERLQITTDSFLKTLQELKRDPPEEPVIDEAVALLQCQPKSGDPG